MKRLAISVTVLLVVSACGALWPVTDIVQISSEDVGDFEVEASRTGDTFTATVCAVRPDNAERIVRRIVSQRFGKGYKTMRFDVMPWGENARGPVRHLTWTASAGVQMTSQDQSGSTDRCRMSPVTTAP